MAIEAIVAVAALAETGYSISKQEQASRDATRDAQNANTLLDQNAAKQRKADADATAKAAQAATVQRRKSTSAFGAANTILTGPQGTPTPAPTERKTLLGL